MKSYKKMLSTVRVASIDPTAKRDVEVRSRCVVKRVSVAKPLQANPMTPKITVIAGPSTATVVKKPLSIADIMIETKPVPVTQSISRSYSSPIDSPPATQFPLSSSFCGTGGTTQDARVPQTIIGCNQFNFDPRSINRQWSDPYIVNVNHNKQTPIQAGKANVKQDPQYFAMFQNQTQYSQWADQYSQQSYNYYMQMQKSAQMYTQNLKQQAKAMKKQNYSNYIYPAQIQPTSDVVYMKQLQPKKEKKVAQPVVPYIIHPIENTIENLDLELPDPVKNYVEKPQITTFCDAAHKTYNFCCTCKAAVNDGKLIQCHVCKCFMHETCFNVAREDERKPFVCPFCRRQKISCKCNNNLNYTLPLIKCTCCGKWVHKRCEGIGFGRVPDNFKCSKCSNGEKYHLPNIDFTEKDESFIVNIDCDRFDLVSALPDGKFRQMIVEDLNRFDLSYADMMKKYVTYFGELLYTGNTDFWKVFVETFTSLFVVPKENLYNTIDRIFTRMFYRTETTPSNFSFRAFSHSESITDFIKDPPGVVLDKIPKPAKIYLDGDDVVKAGVALAENDFICDLPGFVLHIDEVNAENGIPDSVISIDDTDVVIDLDGSSFDLAPKIKRSLYPNCTAKFYIVKNEVRVGLFVIRVAGPNEDKPPRDPTIMAFHELRLPFDCEIPYPLEKASWREKKGRNKSNDSNSGNQKKNKKKEEEPHQISLLSSFLDDSVSVLPLSIVISKETAEKKKNLLA